MSRLLHVNFSRMWKSRLFWGEMIGMFALGVLFVISALRMTQWDQCSFLRCFLRDGLQRWNHS